MEDYKEPVSEYDNFYLVDEQSLICKDHFDSVNPERPVAGCLTCFFIFTDFIGDHCFNTTDLLQIDRYLTAAKEGRR